MPGSAPAQPWSAASAEEIANAAGATDLLVFRRVAEGRFAHIGGVGRGAGWAGIVEVGIEGEPHVASALESGTLVRRSEPAVWRVVGPYYTHSAAIVPIGRDAFAVFGSSEELPVGDADLRDLATFAGEALTDVAPAKRLADEVEALTAVRDLLSTPAATFADALKNLVDHTTTALSCDLGVVFVPDLPLRVTCDLRKEHAPLEPAQVRSALQTLSRWETFPVCVQEATASELPAPFRSTDGVLAYYALELREPRIGLLLLLHTRAGVARGFTLLCQKLGARLVEAAGPLLTTALLRDEMQERLDHAAVMARREPLTGLANRLAWEEALAAASPSLASPLTIVKVDCRGLKRVNDEFGHHIGDQFLRQVAAILIACVRDEDLVARVGGDEFGILLPGLGEEEAREVLERIKDELAAARRSGQGVDLAVGLATTHDDVDAADKQADAQMVAAKRTSG